MKYKPQKSEATMNSINKITKLLIAFAWICLAHFGSYSQTNAQCINASPFCTANPMNFPAATNASAAQSGPCYSCLGSEPNPAWFFMQMATSGPVSINISSNNDVDFCCWGPFTSLAGVCGQLSSCGNVQSCSYSSSATETCTIANAVAGAFYVVLVTNYSNQVQNINFDQTNGNTPGSGVTNCGLVCVTTLSNSGAICAGQNNVLTATTNSAVNSYTLWGPTGIISTNGLANVSNTLTTNLPGLTSSASYTMSASTGTSTCQAITTVTVVQYPSFSITPSNPSICQGGSLTACVTFTSPSVNTGNYSYTWNGSLTNGNFATVAPGVGIFSPGQPCTAIHPSQITNTIATVVYNVVVTPLALSCPVSHSIQLTIINPLTPVLSLPAPLCTTNTPLQLMATPGGGTWTSSTPNPALSPSGLFTPSLIPSYTNNVIYSVNVGTCNVISTGSFIVAQYNPATLTSSITTLCSTLDPALSLMGIVQNTTGSWSGLPVIGTYSFNPLNLPTGTYPIVYSVPSSPSTYSNVCPSYTTLMVPVYKPPTPVITSPNPVCNNSGTVQLVASPLSPGGIWTSNSNAVSALTGILTPTSIANSGTYNVVYTAGQGTCVASSLPADVIIAAFHTAALTGTINNLCANSNPVNLLSITQSTLGYWSSTGLAASNVNTTTSIFYPGVTATSPPGTLPLNGVYTLLYTNPSTPAAYAGLCPDTRTISVSVLNPPYASIVPVGPYCSIAGAVQLSVTPNTGIWTASPYLTSGGIFTPSLSPVGNSIVQYVIGTSTCNTQQVASISVEAFVPATITGSVPDQCTTNSPVNLLPLTLNSGGLWSGIGVLGSNFNPAIAGTGTLTLTYHTASSPSGLCPDQSTVNVSVFSLATPVIDNMGPFCTSSLPVMLGVSPVGGVFGGANTSAVDAAGLFNPGSGLIGKNIVNYSITSGPCIAYAQTTISVEQFVSADFISTEGPFCKNDPRLARNLNESVLNPGGQWTGSGVNGNGLFTFANANIGANIVFYGTNSVPTKTLCPDTKTLEIDVYDTPPVTIAPEGSQQGCAPFHSILNITTNIGGADLWEFSDGSTITSTNTFGADHVFNTPGTYSVVLTYSLHVAEDLACVTQQTFGPIKVFETPHPDFIAPEEVMLSEPTVQLTNTSASVEHYKYQWTIDGNGLDETLNDIDPVITLPGVGNYQVTLSATSLNNCKAQVSKIINVKTEFNAYIPNSFTPNGDNVNDYFMPVFSDYGLDATTYEFQIFDRWGTMVFQTKDRTQGWDGRKSGQLVKMDVYIYKLKYKDTDGNVYNKVGNVTVLR